MSLKKGKIIVCDEKGKQKHSITFTFNPSSYTIKSTPVYQTTPNLGQDGEDSVFISGAARELSTTLFFDSAGDKELFPSGRKNRLSEDKVESMLKPVSDKTKLLMESVRIVGNQHKPPKVIFSWGNLNFKGFITSLSEEYTMFTRQGKPIRAKVAITIKEDLDDALVRKKSPFESPDRTKTKVIVEGMSLWNIAYEEYDDCEKWRIIAKANNIKNPLDIKPGQIIKIPALN